jgi:DNA-binding response OmpR family regulator
MLDSLAQGDERPISREQLLRAVWGYEGEANTRTVETHIWRLRKKSVTPGRFRARFLRVRASAIA